MTELASRSFVNGWLKRCDKGQLTILARIVQSVTHNEFVRDREARPVGPEIVLTAIRFVEEHAGVHGGWILGEDLVMYALHRVARIENVVDQQDVLVRNFGFERTEYAGSCFGISRVPVT